MAAQAEQDAELYATDHIQFNMREIGKIRQFMCIVAGCTAGTLGATGLAGFALYVTLYVLTSAGMLFKMGMDVASYVPKTTTVGFLFGGVQSDALSFVLWWTLTYALCHIY